MAGLLDHLTGSSARRVQSHCTNETPGRSYNRFLSPVSDRRMPCYAAKSTQSEFTHSVITGSLRDYQLKGLHWLQSLHTSRLNGILADEMGLGKTVQVIAFLLALEQHHGLIGPHLLIMPLSVISSWKSDIAKFGAHHFDLFIHHGDRDSREEAFCDWYRGLKSNRRNKRKVALFVTTYELALKDEHLLARLGKRNATVGWEYLIVDEAHRLKNKNSLLFEVLNRVHDTGRRLLLTGTPLQNNLSELWALLHFILPGIFRSEEEFTDLFSAQLEIESDVEDEIGDPSSPRRESSRSKLFRMMNMHSVVDLHKRAPLSQTEYRTAVLAQLHDLLKPYILRRVKSDVALELPPKVEKVVYCPLSGLQREIYRVFRTRAETPYLDPMSDSVDGSKGWCSSQKKSLNTTNNLLMQLRKLCNHPFLVLEDMQTIPDELYYDRLVGASGKLFVLDKLLTKLLEQGSKVLIFSQMTAMLDILQGYLQCRGVSCARLDGSTSHDARESQLREFNSSLSSNMPGRNLNVGDFEGSETTHDSLDTAEEERSPSPECSNHSVFLLSTRAGGVGINLQAADTVILFDSDWNPQADLQAISRAHRIGQTRPVLVLRLVSTGPDEHTYSVEQRILRRAAKKLNAERQVLANGLFDLSDQAENADFVTPQTVGRAAVHCITPDGSQESLLALFETITDTESVTTDSSSPVPKDFTRANAAISSINTPKTPQGPPIQRTGPSLRPAGAINSLIDMYQLDFTASGVDRICARAGDTVLESPETGTDPELSELMQFTDKALWMEWFGDEIKVMEDVERNACDVEAREELALHSSARKRGYADKSIWKKIHGCSEEDSSSGGEEALYRSGRKARRCQASSAGSRRQSRARSSSARSRRRLSDADSDGEEEDGEYTERSPRGRTQRPASQNTMGNDACRAAEEAESLREDDICALCNQAWVTQREITTFLNLKNKELLQRTPAVSPEPARQVSTTQCRTGSASKRGASRGHSSTDSLLGLVGGSKVNTKTAAPPASASKEPPVPPPAPVVNSAEMVNMMILCDGCDGSYHMICIGLDRVPEEDWYCRLCL